MSKAVPLIHVVCEGSTDFIVIEAAISALVDREIVLEQIQPETSLFAGDAGPHGGGWKGVRAWCRASIEAAGSFSSALLNPDILIMHIDADIAVYANSVNETNNIDDLEIRCKRPCPPCSDTTNALRVVMLGWMSESEKPNKVVFCTPAQNTEAWVLAALYPSDRHVNSSLECRENPEAILVGKPARERLVRREGRRYRKDLELYKEKQSTIQAHWPNARSICTEADRFSKDFSVWSAVA